MKERCYLSPSETSKKGGRLFRGCDEIPGDFPEVKFISKSLNSTRSEERKPQEGQGGN